MAKITKEQAEIEITQWLDEKKVFEETRETFRQHIGVLNEAMVNGVLLINENGLFEHTLLFPMGEGQNALTKLTYRKRISDSETLPYMKGVKSDDGDRRVNALLAALTDSTNRIIEKLESGDKRIASAIGVFFM